MAMTKQDYEQLGRHDAEGGGASSMGDASKTSWQFRAYMTGYNSVKKAKHGVHHLTARQEHIRLLYLEVNTVSLPLRKVRRLYSKIDVLLGREALCGST